MIDLQTVLDDAIASQSVPGAVALIGNSQGVTASAVSGTADPTNDMPMHLDSIFQIASMTKAVTSVAAMQLVERGLLTLHDPIGAVLPALANPQVLIGFDDDGKALTKPAETPITLRHLLTHTSGLGYPFTCAKTAQALGEVAPVSMASISAPLIFEPGTNWLYGVNTDWIGLAVETASGQSLEDYTQQNILAPLKMVDTSFELSADKVGRRVAMHAKVEGDFAPFPVEIGGGTEAEFQSGGAGLYSTASDYFRFMQMVLNKGELEGARILSDATIADMSRNQVGSIRAGVLHSVIPQLAHHFDPFPDMASQWGLGFVINPEQGPNGRAAGSLAWAGIANSYYWIDRASNIAGLVLMQFLPFADPDALEVYKAVEQAAY